MENIIPNDTRYVPLTQQPYCCVPTCIQMIMLRHKIPLQSAELMAHHMKIVVSAEKKDLFWNLPYAEERPKSGFGTTVSEDKTINTMFHELNIPLLAEFKLIDEFESFKSLGNYLIKKSNADIILCYDYGILFKTGKHSGHVSIFDLLEDGRLRFIDPESNTPKWRVVNIDDLYNAMKEHGSKFMAGCWEIKRA